MTDRAGGGDPIVVPVEHLARSAGTLAPTNLRLGGGGNAELSYCRRGGRPWLYKRYRDAPLGQVNVDALVALIRWRRELPPDTRVQLDRLAAWPRSLVVEQGTPRGVLLPVAPEPFFRRLALSEVGMGARWVWEPRMLIHLIHLPDNPTRYPGAPRPVRLRAFGHAALGLAWFHQLGVVVHDVHANNILCAADGSAVYFVDCDVMTNLQVWGQVTPTVAPELLRPLLPSGPPTPATDFARLAWSLVWIVLDSFSEMSIDFETHRRLREQLTTRVADFLAHAAHPSRFRPQDVLLWQELAREWTGNAPSPPHRHARLSTPISPLWTSAIADRPLWTSRIAQRPLWHAGGESATAP